MAVTVNAQWQTVGTAGFSAGDANYTSLAFSNSNEPYVAYADGANSGKATVMKFVNTPTGINELNEVNNTIAVYPNPASTITTIAGLAVGQSLQVMDVTGKLVYQTVVKSSTLELELTNFENGVYIIQVEQNGAVAQKTLIVNK
ncbi:MAG: T9SS type A sorting domain-containing protein [Bacteroidia bacterium]|nr:T9SS type A sorting domain-containing protein [Bacteroidia bacterium]